MANTNQSIRTCILKVDLKCCSGCQKKAITKLQTISGVSGAEYNAEKGLMKVTGGVEPMTLVHKLTRWGRKTELVSVNYHLDDPSDDDQDSDDASSDDDTSSTPDPQIQEKTNTNTKKKKGILSMPFFGCFSSKSKVAQPFAMRNRNWHVPSKFENGGPGFGGFPFANHSTLQWPPPYRMRPLYHPMMQQQQMQQPQAPMPGALMQNNANNMSSSGPPRFQAPPYFMSNKPQPVNPRLHYSEK